MRCEEGTGVEDRIEVGRAREAERAGRGDGWGDQTVSLTNHMVTKLKEL